MINPRNCAGCALLLLLSSLTARGQANGPEASLTAAVNAAQQRYIDSFGINPQLYSGPEYVDYAKKYHARTNHQFFWAPELQTGTVHYNGQQYRNVGLSYDVVRDQVVLKQPSNPLTLRLINEQVRGFTIVTTGGAALPAEHRFVRLRADSTAGGVIRTGYYEVLADGRAQFLAKRAKRLQEEIVQGYVDVEFITTDRLYLKKDGVYYSVSGKPAVLRLLSDRGKELQQFAQEQRLSFKKDRAEKSLTELVAYYNKLQAQ